MPVSIPIWGRVSRSFDINDSGHYRPREFLGESPWKTLEETDSFDQLAVPWEDVDKQPSHSEPFQELLQELLQESPQESQPATLRSDRLWRGHLPFLDEKVLISMPSKASTARTVLTHCFRFHRRVNELRAWSTQVQTSRLQRVLLQSEPFRSLQNFSQNPRVIRLWIAFHRNRLPSENVSLNNLNQATLIQFKIENLYPLGSFPDSEPELEPFKVYDYLRLFGSFFNNFQTKFQTKSKLFLSNPSIQAPSLPKSSVTRSRLNQI